MRIIVDLAGGFGNQLFCYSFGYALAKRKGAELAIDTSMQDNGIARDLELLELNVRYHQRISYIYKEQILDRAIFNKIRRLKSIGLTTRIYTEDKPTVYEKSVFDISKNTYFKGNWQSEKYFSSFRSDLLRMLTPKKERSESVKKICVEMHNCNSVAVHIRRGDYVKIGCQLNMDYYVEAIRMIKSFFCNKDVALYIFSDDINYCEKFFANSNISDDKTIIIQYPEYVSDDYTLDDLLLMSHCKHMIMANSSYSWWAAWLNQNEGKTIICPELGMWSGDFYPEEWIKIKCD